MFQTQLLLEFGAIAFKRQNVWQFRLYQLEVRLSYSQKRYTQVKIHRR